MVHFIQKHKTKIFFIVISLSINQVTLGTNQQTGSSTAVSSQVASVQYLTTTNNAVLFGAVMTAGFSFGPLPASAIWNSCFPVFGNVSMNGGTLTLARDMYWGNGSTLANGGIFTCANFSVIFPEQNTGFVIGTSASTFNGGNVTFNSPVTLNTTLNFGGICVLDGRGNVINCGSAGKIAVGAGASLLIKNAVLQGISGSAIFCQDNLGTVSLQNVTIVQDGNYTFTLGIMNILNDVEFTGSSVFAFRSTNSLNINSYSTLMFDVGNTFSYDTTNASLLNFSDSSATLFLNGATLYATGTGINLTDGTLNIDSNSFFVSTGTLGVTIGSCIFAEDLQVNMFNNSQLTVNQGLMNYKNVNAASFNMFNGNVLLSMGVNTTLNVFRNLNGLGSVVFGNNTTLGTSPGASLLMNSLQQGTISFTTLPTC